MDKDLHERFLQANANPQNIAWQFSEVLRNLMRAVAATTPSMQIYAAVEAMNHVAELLQRCEEPLTWHAIFTEAIDIIQSELPGGDSYDGRYIRAAKDGVKFLVESSAADNAARARASRRLHEFLMTMKDAQQPRDLSP